MSYESHEKLNFPNPPELPDPTSFDGQRLAHLDIQRQALEQLEQNGVIDKAKDILINSQYDDNNVVHFFGGKTVMKVADLAAESGLATVHVGAMPVTNSDGEPLQAINALRFSRVEQLPDGELAEAYAWVPLLKPQDTNHLNADFSAIDYILVDEAILKVDEVGDEAIDDLTEDLTGVQRVPDKPYVLY